MGCDKRLREKCGGDSPNVNAIEEFNNCLLEAELQDVKWRGKKFTWWNKQIGKDSVECKLDGVLCEW